MSFVQFMMHLTDRHFVFFLYLYFIHSFALFSILTGVIEAQVTAKIQQFYRLNKSGHLQIQILLLLFLPVFSGDWVHTRNHHNDLIFNSTTDSSSWGIRQQFLCIVEAFVNFLYVSWLAQLRRSSTANGCLS